MFPFYINAQNKDFILTEDDELFLDQLEIIVEDSLSQKDHWLNLNNWISEYFKIQAWVVDFKDESAGRMIVKGDLEISGEMIATDPRYGLIIPKYFFSIQVDCRDNKYRIKFLESKIVIIAVLHDDTKDLPTKK